MFLQLFNFLTDTTFKQNTIIIIDMIKIAGKVKEMNSTVLMTQFKTQCLVRLGGGRID